MSTYSGAIAETADDAWFTYPTGGSFTNNYGYMPVGNLSGSHYASAFRFTAVDIPQGATINSATITFIARNNATSTVCNLAVRGVAEDDATAITGYIDAHARTLTTASVDWLALNIWTAGASRSAPDIASIIQEIINRAGWSSGNALVIYVIDNGSDTNANRYITDYSGNAGQAAHLTIDYTAGAAGQSIDAAAISAGSSLYGPQIDRTLPAATIASTAALYGVTVVQQQFIAAAVLSSGASLYGATVIQQQFLDAAAIASAGTLYGATLVLLQTAAPVADIGAGNWTPSSGSDLYAMLDEATPNDSDYIISGNDPSSDTCEVKLHALSDPLSSDYHRLRCAIARRAACKST